MEARINPQVKIYYLVLNHIMDNAEKVDDPLHFHWNMKI